MNIGCWAFRKRIHALERASAISKLTDHVEYAGIASIRSDENVQTKSSGRALTGAVFEIRKRKTGFVSR
jgi:phage protein D